MKRSILIALFLVQASVSQASERACFVTDEPGANFEKKICLTAVEFSPSANRVKIQGSPFHGEYDLQAGNQIVLNSKFEPEESVCSSEFDGALILDLGEVRGQRVDLSKIKIHESSIHTSDTCHSSPVIIRIEYLPCTPDHPACAEKASF